MVKKTEMRFSKITSKTLLKESELTTINFPIFPTFKIKNVQ